MKPKSNGRFKKGEPNPHAFKSGAENPRSKKTADIDIVASGTEITPQQLEVLTRLAAVGVRPTDLRLVVNMSQSVWQSYCAAHPEVHDAIAKGEGRMHDRIAAVLIRKALKGDSMSAALLLNGRFGYRPGEGGAGDSRVQVNIVNIPAADNSTPVEGKRLRDIDDDDPKRPMRSCRSGHSGVLPKVPGSASYRQKTTVGAHDRTPNTQIYVIETRIRFCWLTGVRL
jgi:hypothetical protein